MQTNKKMTILLVDDHAIFRQGLRSLLEVSDSYKVIGEARKGAEAVEMAGELCPDIIIMDITMPGMDGIEATRRIKEFLPEVKILMLSMYADNSYTREVFRAGASGFVSKGGHFSELMLALENILEGKPYLSSSVLGPLIEDYMRLSPSGEARLSYEKLSAREKEVFQLLSRGCRRQEISEKLFITPKTVDKHRKSIKEKLDFQNDAELVRFADLLNKKE